MKNRREKPPERNLSRPEWFEQHFIRHRCHVLNIPQNINESITWINARKNIFNIDFSNMYLRLMSFYESTLTNCSFDGADLRDADFTRTKFIDCTFKMSFLNSVRAIDCEFINCTGTLPKITSSEDIDKAFARHK